MILAIDPAGNYIEGKGTTGLCLLDSKTPAIEMAELRAKDFSSPEAYWKAHIDVIYHYDPKYIVMEGYRLYHHKGMKADSQANSELETPQLIGAIKVGAWNMNKNMHIQFAAEVKQRWSEKVLVAKDILEEKNGRYYLNGKPTNQHQRDALKHALHFRRYHMT